MSCWLGRDEPFVEDDVEGVNLLLGSANRMYGGCWPFLPRRCSSMLQHDWKTEQKSKVSNINTFRLDYSFLFLLEEEKMKGIPCESEPFCSLHHGLMLHLFRQLWVARDGEGAPERPCHCPSLRRKNQTKQVIISVVGIFISSNCLFNHIQIMPFLIWII